MSQAVRLKGRFVLMASLEGGRIICRTRKGAHGNPTATQRGPLGPSPALILMRVQVETNYPRPCCQAAKTVGVGGQTG